MSPRPRAGSTRAASRSAKLPLAVGGRPSLRQEQTIITRKRLIDAGLRVFDAYGYIAVTVDDIVREAGVSRATFYVYYPGKLELLEEITDNLDTGVAEIYERLDALVDADRAGEGMEDWIDDALAWFEGRRGLIRVWEEAGMAGAERFDVHARLDAIAAAMPRYLSRWPSPRRGEATLRLQLLVVQLAQFCHLWPASGTTLSKRDRSIAVSVLADFWRHGLRPPGAANEYQ